MFARAPGTRPDGRDGGGHIARHGGDLVRVQPQLSDVRRVRQRRQSPHLRSPTPSGRVHRVVERVRPTDDAGTGTHGVLEIFSILKIVKKHI